MPYASDSSQELIDRATFLKEIVALEKRLEAKIEYEADRREASEQGVASLGDLAGEAKAFFSTRGYSKIVGTDSLFKKMSWLISGFVLTSACLFFVARSFQNYLKFDTVTQLTITREKAVVFPSVSVCILKYDQELPLAESNSIDLGSVLTSCNFNDEQRSNCSVDDFYNFPIIIPSESKSLNWSCYQINGGRNATNQEAPVMSSTTFGVGTGYTFVFDLELDSMVQYFVGDTKVLPLFSELVKILQPGMNAFVSVEKAVESKLPEPYSLCAEDIDEDTSAWVRAVLQQNVTYRKDYCDQLRALSQSDTALGQDSLADCPLECQTVAFDVQQSVFSPNEVTPSRTLKVGFFYSNAKVTVVSQSAKTTEADLISNIGGVLGLFLELSLVSVYRLVNLLYDMLLSVPSQSAFL